MGVCFNTRSPVFHIILPIQCEIYNSNNNLFQQKCFQVQCVLAAAVAIWGDLHQASPLAPDCPRPGNPPGSGTPWDQTP